ncbi:MAG: glycosyltransferase WbuB [Chitinophagaceae bacterium]|nr:MAG: glycosyltransferase WbuB [Chitinophagaceae bacterium]
MKRILYLSFYFEPDLCAGSFRNTPLVKELARQLGPSNELVVITTMPNRYNTFKIIAPRYEEMGNIKIHRIAIPEHKSGFLDQIFSFYAFYKAVHEISRKYKYDLVFASSSRLFTAYLGHKMAREAKSPLYLDIRDIFADTMKDVLKSKALKIVILPLLRLIENRTFSTANHINLISGGFAPYFEKYTQPAYTYFSNGIDEEFVDLEKSNAANNVIKRIIYAGNIGEGQGLHTIVPQAAKQLEGKFEFCIIGDGGARGELQELIDKMQLSNVKLINPVKRTELLAYYKNADFFFLHLNDYEAFKKVLPSKIFELAAYDKPILAGVGGFAKQFIQQNVSNTIVFDPCDVNSFVSQLLKYEYATGFRTGFIQKFRRSNINAEMSSSIVTYLP